MKSQEFRESCPGRRIPYEFGRREHVKRKPKNEIRAPRSFTYTQPPSWRMLLQRTPSGRLAPCSGASRLSHRLSKTIGAKTPWDFLHFSCWFRALRSELILSTDSPPSLFQVHLECLIHISRHILCRSKHQYPYYHPTPIVRIPIGDLLDPSLFLSLTHSLPKSTSALHLLS